jgi:hypothetical protein
MEATNKKAIIGIKIKDGGMKGLEILYCQQDEKDGKVWNNEYWTARKVPVGEELENVIKAFRYYLLDILGYEMENCNVADVVIKEVNFNSNVEIKGDFKILNGIHSVKLGTGKIDESMDYDKIVELSGLVKQLRGEIEKYMEGKSVMSESQLVMQFYKKKGKFDEVEFAGMSDEDKKMKATEILEQMGSIVIHNEDMGVGGTEEVVENVEMIEESHAISREKSGIIENLGTSQTEMIQPNFEEQVVAEEDIAPELAIEDEDELVLMVTPVKAI